MKSLKALAVIILLTGAAFSSLAKAQMFSASTGVTADTDVDKSGTTAFAFSFYDFNHSTTTAVNTVTFAGTFANGGVGFSYGSATLTGGDQNGTTLTTASPGVSQNYVNVLTNLKYTNGATSYLQFTGLTANENYELQVFAGGGATGTETLTDTAGGTPGALDFGSGNNTNDTGVITESFTAGSGTETIDISSPTDGYILFNAVNLRDVGAAPEPSTYALIGLGLASILVARRFRKLSA